MSDLLDTALILAQRDETNALIELLQNARRWRSTDSSGGGVRDLTGDQVIAALGYQPATQAEAGTGETTIKDALGYVPAQSEGGVGLSGNENNKLNIASAGVGKREVATELAGSGLAGGDGSPMAVDQTVARTDRDETFNQDVALDDGAGTGGLLRGEEGTVEVRKQGSPTQYGRLRASEVEVVDGNTATELRSQVVEISDSLLETNTDAAADAWGGLYTYRGRKEDATGTGLISKGIAWSPAAERFGQVDVDARKNDSGDNVGSGVQSSTFAPYARVNRQESITKDWTFGGDIGTDDFVSRTTGWEIQQDGSADFRKMWADELKVQAFTADVAQALAGTEVLTKSRATLAENFTVPPSGSSATLTVEDINGQKGTRAFEAGDTVRLRVVDRSGGGLLVADVWGTVSGYTDHGDGTQSWTYSVTDDGAADGKVVYEGAVALDWGQSGDGQIYSTVLDDAGSPYTDVRTWTDSDGDSVPDSYDTFVRLGVLDGISGLSGEGLYTRRGRFTDDILIGSLDKSGQYLEADGGTVTLKGSLNIIGGSGVSNLSDAGALATEDAADYGSQVSGGPPSDATKGATWGDNLGEIPDRIEPPADKDSGLYATATHFGYYSGSNWSSVLYDDGSGSFAGGAIQWDAEGDVLLKKSVAIGGRYLSTAVLSSEPDYLWHFDGTLSDAMQGQTLSAGPIVSDPSFAGGSLEPGVNPQDTGIPVAGRSEWSLSMWCRTTSTANYSTLWYMGTPDYGYTALAMYGFGDNFEFRWEYANNEVDKKFLTSINDGKWHHIAVSYSETTGYMSIWVDGVQDAKFKMFVGGTGGFTDENIFIGTGRQANKWRGQIDDVALWTGHAISQKDVNLIYKSGVPLQESPQSAASTAEANAKSYTDGQVGALGGLDQIQDTTYIQGGLIDTGLLDTDAVTADKLFVDKTMTENILAEDATITGTLTMGSGSSPGIITNQGSDFQLTDRGLDLLSAGGKEGSSAITFYDGFNGGDYKGSLFANNDGIILRGDDVTIGGTNIKIDAFTNIKLRYSGTKMLDLDDFLLGSLANDPGESDLDPNQGMIYITSDPQLGRSQVKVAIRNSEVNGNGQVTYKTLVEGTY